MWACAAVLAFVPVLGAGIWAWLLGPAKPSAETMSMAVADLAADSGPVRGHEVAASGTLAERGWAWPADRLDGDEAKELLLVMLEEVQTRLREVPGYEATFHRQERINGKLGAEQRIKLKVRHAPLGIYMRFVHPEEGKEVIFAEGKHDGHVLGHPGGLARHVAPLLKVPPDSRLAMAGNRHPVTDAGILALVHRLVGFRRLDLGDPNAETVLDRHTDSLGRAWLRSIHQHKNRKTERPFAYVEVLYDPETGYPHQITSHDWPEDGTSGAPPLGERYRYEDLRVLADLTDEDFDPRNPAYQFKRF
jgi:hypothetical protein